VFELQEEIATTIATRLRGTLRGEAEHGRARSGTKNLEAYELLLKGRALQNRRGRFIPEAIACFERAIALDPNYGQAIAWLSDSYRLKGTFGTAPFAEVMPKARQLAERALAIDSGLVEAWATLAAVEEQFEWNTARAEAMWDRAMAADPRHATSRSHRALWGFMRGVISAEAAIAESRRAIQDDPLSAWIRAVHSHLLGSIGRHEESITEAERAIELDADSFMAHWNRMRGYAWAGQYQRAIDLAPSVMGISGRHHFVLGTLAWVYGKAGKPELARAVYDELEARSRHEFLSPFWLAVAASSAGLPDRAIEQVARCVAERDPLVCWGRAVPFWEAIRAHPRFAEMTREVWD